MDSSGEAGNAEEMTRRRLTVEDHRRDAAGMKYVYPVLSRRAGGVSLGINLNVNNACNWACIYCQVPYLVRGGPPSVNLGQLESELRQLLDDVLAGRLSGDSRDDEQAPPPRLADIAFSGNGEPTSADEFPQAVDVVVSVLRQRGVLGQLPIRVITNGSLLHREPVQAALRRLAEHRGEVWFKVDRATEAGMRTVNQTAASINAVVARLRLSAAAAPTWLQTCWFGIDGLPPDAEEIAAYVGLVDSVAPLLAGVHVYGIARPSMQPDAGRLSRLDPGLLEALAEQLKRLGLRVTVSP